MFSVLPNNNLEYGAVPMDTDHVLCNVAPPLDVITSGSLILLIGASGSGKTSLLCNLISKPGKINGYKQSFRKAFHKVILCSPSTQTLKKNIFKIPDDQKYKEFNHCMDELEDHLDASEIQTDIDGETKYNLLILDDVAASLRANRGNEMLLTKLLQNRRHKNLTCIILVQKFTMIPPSIRSNANVVFIVGRPKTIQEQDAITNEILPIARKDAMALFDFIYDKKYVHLMIDMTLKKSDKFRYFKSFKEIVFPDS
jgi:hypothetical protein